MKTTDQLYEELRAVIDNGHESMTHEDALAHVVELGVFDTPLEAHAAYLSAKKQYHPTSAR